MSEAYETFDFFRIIIQILRILQKNQYKVIRLQNTILMASDVECITLDDSDEEQGVAVAPVPRVQGQGAIRRLAPVPALAAGPLVREEQMMRCNLCVDPGLLPVEEDRAAHRYSPNDLVLMLIF